MNNFLTNRIIVGLIIIITGAIASFTILSTDQSNITKNTNTEKSTEKNLLSYESLISQPQEGNSSSDQEGNFNTGNATESLINSISSDIVNSEGEKISREKVDERIDESFNNYFKKDKFTLKDIKISESNSKQSQIEYIEKVDKDLNKIIADGFNGETATTTIRKFLEEDNSEPLDYLISSIPDFIDALLETEVPPSLAQTHVDLLNVWQKKLNLYTAIKNYEEDQLKALMAIKKFPDIVKSDLNIQKSIINKYNELNNAI